MLFPLTISPSSATIARVGGIVTLAFCSLLSSCTSSGPKIQGVPSDLPNIPLYGPARTPPHNMRHGDYPFDSNGNYVTSWAAEGGASPGPSDYRPAKHHDDSPPPRRTVSSASTVKPKSKSKVEDSPPKKVASSTPKKDSPTPSKSSSPPSKKPVGKSSGGGGSAKHVVKSSDTLFGLAKKYGTTVAKIKAANGLTSDSLRDGRTLTIPK